MARVGLVKTINLHSLEQALIKGVMSSILVLIICSVADCWEVVRWALQRGDGLQLGRRF